MLEGIGLRYALQNRTPTSKRRSPGIGARTPSAGFDSLSRPPQLRRENQSD
jgi:hypothetical protein